MTFYQLECFIAAAQEESFVAAAKKLITTQPVITYQIGTLEKEMGVQLFDRSKRRVSLSAAGMVFYDDARALVADCRAAVERAQAVSRHERSRLRIGIRRFSNYGDISEMIRQQSEGLGDSGGEGGLTMVDVTDGADIDMGLGSVEHLLCHCGTSSLKFG